MIAFQGSSFFRILFDLLIQALHQMSVGNPYPLTAQSYVEKRPPQTPKLPPSTGALAFMAVIAPILRSP